MFGFSRSPSRLVDKAPVGLPADVGHIFRGRYSRAGMLVGLLLLFLSGGPSFLQAQDAGGPPSSDVCDRALDAADDQYREAAYGEALRLVSACLNQNDRSEAQSIRAYRQLALIHLKRDELDQARAAIVNLLGVDAGYQADPVSNPPAYVSLVTVVKENLQRTPEAVATAEPTRKKPFFRRTSTWVVLGGVLVGGGVAAAVAGGGGGSSAGGGGGGLPVPPALPPAP